MTEKDPLLEIESQNSETPKKSTRWFVVAMLAVGFCIGFSYQLVSMFIDYSDSMKAVRQKVTSANEYLTKLTVDGTDSAVRFWKEVGDLRRASEQNAEVQQIIERNKKVNERIIDTNKSIREEMLSLQADRDKLKADNEALSGAITEAKLEYERVKKDTETLRNEKTGYFLRMDDVKRGMLEAMDRNTATGRRLKSKYFERVSLINAYYDVSRQPAAIEAMSQLCDSILPNSEEHYLQCKVTDVYSKFSKLDLINFY